MSEVVETEDSRCWFRTLVDSAPEVYFRYALHPARRLDYLSPSVEALTGHSAAALMRDPGLWWRQIPARDRRELCRVLRASRGLTLHFAIQRSGILIPLRLRSVPVVRQRRVVAVEGVVTSRLTDSSRGPGRSDERPVEYEAPVQQQLLALLSEVRDLLRESGATPRRRPSDLTLGELRFDPERLLAFERGVAVPLTSRESLLLRYLLESRGRVVTRRQLLSDVWNNSHSIDERTVNVHVSRLRSKLPSLRSHLVTVRHVGYRLTSDMRDLAVGE